MAKKCQSCRSTERPRLDGKHGTECRNPKCKPIVKRKALTPAHKGGLK